MPAFEPNTQKLLYYDPDQSRSTVTTFTEEIKSAEGELVFTIFLLAEIRTDEHTENQYFYVNSKMLFHVSSVHKTHD